jgi:hypothetical protein
MERVMPSFEYEPLVLFPKLMTLGEEKDRGNIDGVGPSCTKTTKELGDLKGGKDSPKRKVVGKTNTSKETLEQIKSILQEVSFQEYAYVATKIGE